MKFLKAVNIGFTTLLITGAMARQKEINKLLNGEVESFENLPLRKREKIQKLILAGVEQERKKAAF